MELCSCRVVSKRTEHPIYLKNVTHKRRIPVLTGAKYDDDDDDDDDVDDDDDDDDDDDKCSKMKYYSTYFHLIACPLYISVNPSSPFSPLHYSQINSSHRRHA